MAEDNQRVTGILVFCVFVAVIGNSLLFGFNIGVVNTPSKIIQTFYNKTYYERNGGNWENVISYEQFLEDKEKQARKEGQDGTSKHAGPEEFGVDTNKLLSKWQIDLLWSTTVALFVFFGMVGAFTSVKIADYFGRKKGMMLITFIVLVAAIFGGLPLTTKSPELLMLSRVFVGLHSGLNISLCPLYLAEISPRRVRGAIGTCHQLAITIGILMSQILGLPDLLGTENSWPLLFAFNALPALLSIALMPFCPESPRFLLIKKGQVEDARTVLVRIRGNPNVDEEMEEMRVEAAKSMGVTNYSLKELLTAPDLRLPVIIACVIHVSQQWSGINAVMSYSTFIFSQASVQEEYIPYVIVGIGTINVLTTVVAVPLMEKLGRRALLLLPMVVMTISFILLTIFLNLLSMSSLEDSVTAFAIVCIIVTHTYIIGFAVGLGPIPFIVVGELFRQEPRAAAMSLSLACNWTSNFILMLIFPFMNDAMGPFTYLVFCIILITSFVFIYFFVPETKNKTFDEIANSMAYGKTRSGEQERTADYENQPRMDNEDDGGHFQCEVQVWEEPTKDEQFDEECQPDTSTRV